MTKLQNLRIEFQTLTKKLNEYDIAYYIESNPIVSDAEYDGLKQRVKTVIDEVNAIQTNDITELKVIKSIQKDIKKYSKKVGASPSRKFLKVKHLVPMLSLSNCFSETDVSNFLNRISTHEIACELKIDGVSFSAIYDDGILQRALTRGDGETGEDITANIKQINGFPIQIDYTHLLEVRGEIYMSKQTFARLEGFSNPRNAASGSIRQLNPQITKQRNLQYFVWDLKRKESEYHLNDLMFAKELGFCVNDKIFLAKSFQEMMQFYNMILNTRNTLEYEIDGVVYKINDKNTQQELGNTGNSPRWATAHKFPAEEFITKIVNIVIQIGKSGVIIPVAELEPINIGGARITRVTLHNASELYRHDYRVGDLVKIVRSGDVIPKINGVAMKGTNSHRFEIPKNCPVCGSVIIDDSTMTHKLCTGDWNCEAQRIERLKHFVSRYAFNIIGLGEKQIEYFVKHSLIKNYAHIFLLEIKNLELSEPIQSRSGWGEKSVQELFQAIRNAKKIEFHRFLYSLSIPLVGIEVATLIANKFSNYEELMKNLNSETLQQINGIGEQIAESIVNFFTNSYHKEMIANLLQHIEIIQMNKNDSNAKVFAFTGALETITRAEAEKFVKDSGNIFSSTITRKVNFVVIGNDPSLSKLEKIQKLGIKILTENEFISTMKKT